MRSADPYANLGLGYADVRRPDPRIAAVIQDALGDARTVVNVGAGAGSYEPSDRDVVAVEPSPTMIAQRPADAAPVVRASAEDLPFADDTFDVGMAVLTVHHWTDAAVGLRELRRVSRRQVLLGWDPAVTARYWLVTDYVPEIAEHESRLPPLESIVDELSGPGRSVTVRGVDVPWDCTDGFLAAHWRRPERYLDPRVRAGMSGLAGLADQSTVESAMRRLAADLDSGAWARRHGDLLERDTLDVGYRLVVAA